MHPAGSSALPFGWNAAAPQERRSETGACISPCSFLTNPRPAWTCSWRAVMQSIEQLRDQGQCILFSTHIMREVERVCNRVAILSRGRIQACGTLAELQDRYGQPDLEELFFHLVA
jgi:ABC-type thiamine transport system ATPase subunit